jgi:hypothetical protein
MPVSAERKKALSLARGVGHRLRAGDKQTSLTRRGNDRTDKRLLSLSDDP